MLKGLKRKLITLLVIAAIIIASVAALSSGGTNQNQQTSNNPNQTPLQIDYSGSGSLQAGGVDLQSATPTNSGASPVSGQSSVQSGNATSTTPTQPSGGTQTQPSYPPCYYCNPANHHLCPERASFYPCYCGGQIYTNDSVACMAQ